DSHFRSSVLLIIRVDQLIGGGSPRETVHIGQLALKSGIWPLKEYIDGKVTHTKVPRKRVPVEDYLSLQGRFRHLFEPTRNEKLLDEIQARVDSYWEKIEQDEAEK
ncbi:hypothetical protein BOW29_01865, partial [Solemya velum gill symbiont]